MKDGTQMSMDQSKAVLRTPPFCTNEYRVVFEYLISAPKVLLKWSKVIVNRLNVGPKQAMACRALRSQRRPSKYLFWKVWNVTRVNDETSSIQLSL